LLENTVSARYVKTARSRPVISRSKWLDGQESGRKKGALTNEAG
jgi:hypothetical protein